MNAMVNFDFEDNGVRALTVEGEPWFVGVDVCRCLNIANPWNALARLDTDEKGLHNMETPGGEQKVTVISEPGVYQLVFTSRSPAAKRFKRWLAHEVLPQIRKTGRYEAKPASPPSFGWQEEVERLNAHVRLVAEARQTFGRAAARVMWARSPLPQIDDGNVILDPAGAVDPADDGLGCLEHLMRHAAGNGASIGKLIYLGFSDAVTRGALERMGIKVILDEKRARVAVAESHESLRDIFAGTPWDGDWSAALLALDGAAVRLTGFDKASLRAVHLPRSLIARVRH